MLLHLVLCMMASISYHSLACPPSPCLACQVYEGIKFKLRMEFSNNYPFVAPSVRFTSPCFHPNVDQQGNICLDILKEKWSASYDVRALLLSIQSLLGGQSAHPVEEYLWGGGESNLPAECVSVMFCGTDCYTYMQIVMRYCDRFIFDIVLLFIEPIVLYQVTSYFMLHCLTFHCK